LLNQKELGRQKEEQSVAQKSQDKGSQEKVYKRLMEFQQKKEEKIKQQRRILEF